MQNVSGINIGVKRYSRDKAELAAVIAACRSATEWLRARLDYIKDGVLRHYAATGRKPVYHLGCWRFLENGQLRPFDEQEREEFEQVVDLLRTEAGVSNKTWVRRDLQACREFSRHLPTCGSFNARCRCPGVN
jgi:hypothetical protein